jgi:hypothetical protein|tara:strand:+ start:696 stop:1007 length:312 start_codon:yes stop_codon:yes gene_type:complete
MSQAIKDLFKLVKELSDKIDSKSDQWDIDYQNIIDRMNALDTRVNTIRLNMIGTNNKVDSLTTYVTNGNTGTGAPLGGSVNTPDEPDRDGSTGQQTQIWTGII